MEDFATDNQHKEYDNEPVLYCKHCLSLRIRSVEGLEDSDYCDKCGSTNISQLPIKEWEQLYGRKYGCNYLESY